MKEKTCCFTGHRYVIMLLTIFRGAAMSTMEMKAIAYIRSDFTEKFGIPRQSGLVKTLEAAIVFEPEFRNPDTLRGLEGYSHIWLLWQFSKNAEEGWSPTVRPPRLGGNKRVGVFASRSPFRPNPIGLSSVEVKKIDLHTKEGPIIYIYGADLLDGTPIYDIKPYLAYVDCHPKATGGFALQETDGRLTVTIHREHLDKVAPDKIQALKEVLAQDPRPGYHHDPQRLYSLEFAGLNISFKVEGDILTVTEISPINPVNKD